MTNSDHFDGRKFFNPRVSSNKSLGELLRWMTSGQRKKWPDHVENKFQPHLPTTLDANEAAITFINHSSFLIQFSGLNILTDPVFSERASPVPWAGPKRIREPGIPFSSLPPIQLVLVSHNHYDHMDVRTLQKLVKQFNPLFVTPLGNGRVLKCNGIRNFIELDWWQSYSFDNETTITATPAQHFSSRTPFDRNRDLWSGFLLQRNKTKIYFAGDSGYEQHFQEIKARVDSIDVALLPIGAYEPRWFMKSVHLNPEEAVKAYLDLGASQGIGMHFGTFHLTDEGIDEPQQALAEALRTHGIDPHCFRTLEFGETFMLRR